MGLDFGVNDDLLFLFTGVHLTMVHICFGGLPVIFDFYFFNVFAFCLAMVVWVDFMILTMLKSRLNQRIVVLSLWNSTNLISSNFLKFIVIKFKSENLEISTMVNMSPQDMKQFAETFAPKVADPDDDDRQESNQMLNRP